MALLADALAARELLQSARVGAVHGRAVVGEQRGERPAYHFAAVEDQDRVSEEAVPRREVRRVELEELEDFDQREGRAGEDALFEVGGWVEVAGVGIHVGEVEVGEAFDVFGRGDEVGEVGVLRGGVDGVVDDDTVGGGEGVVG